MKLDEEDSLTRCCGIIRIAPQRDNRRSAARGIVRKHQPNPCLDRPVRLTFWLGRFNIRGSGDPVLVAAIGRVGKLPKAGPNAPFATTHKLSLRRSVRPAESGLYDTGADDGMKASFSSPTKLHEKCCDTADRPDDLGSMPRWISAAGHHSLASRSCLSDMWKY